MIAPRMIILKISTGEEFEDMMAEITIFVSTTTFGGLLKVVSIVSQQKIQYHRQDQASHQVILPCPIMPRKKADRGRCAKDEQAEKAVEVEREHGDKGKDRANDKGVVHPRQDG